MAKDKLVRDYFGTQVFITTSGHFSTPALLCAMQELGTRSIMFSIDYPCKCPFFPRKEVNINNLAYFRLQTRFLDYFQMSRLVSNLLSNTLQLNQFQMARYGMTNMSQ